MITAAGLPRGHVHIREVRGDEIEVKARKVCREFRLVCTICLGVIAQTRVGARGRTRVPTAPIPFTQVLLCTPVSQSDIARSRPELTPPPALNPCTRLMGHDRGRKLAYKHAVLQ